MLATLKRPNSGSLTVLGHELPDGADVARRQIGYLGHDPGVYLDLSPIQNLELFGDLYGIAERDARIELLLEQVGLIHRAHDATRTFSRGMVQRLGLARMLLHEPTLLLLDEPFSGLDALGAQLLDDVLAQGRSAVIVTHDVERTPEWADRIVVMARGKQVGEIATRGRTGAEVRNDYLGLVA